jgi:hypothetical protein
VRAGWWYLRQHPRGKAIDRFSMALRGFAAAHGAHEKYHETMTVISWSPDLVLDAYRSS